MAFSIVMCVKELEGSRDVRLGAVVMISIQRASARFKDVTHSFSTICAERD